MLHYTDTGSGIPVVWIHGFPLSGRIFAEQMSIKGVRHIVPDLPGFGSSPPQRDASMDSLAGEILDILDALSIEKAAFAGLSMGGYILFAIARRAPERVAAAILIDTRELPDSAEGRAGRFSMMETARTAGARQVTELMLEKMLGSGHRPATAFVREVMESATPAGIVAALQAMMDRPDSTDTLRSLRVPTIILVGDSDTITPPSDSRRMKELISGAELVVVPGASHLSNAEQPDLFNDAVERFVRERVAGSLQS